MTIEIPAGTWNLDPSHSEVGFTVRHAGISKVRGKFDSFSATLVIPENGVGATATASIEAASFNSGNADRDAHVRSADFFDVETYPTLNFEATSVKGDEDGVVVTGDLTIRGITKEVRLDVEVNGVARDAFGLFRAGAETKTVISRKEFGLTWNAALEAGGVLVSDKVTIELDLSFVLEEKAAE